MEEPCGVIAFHMRDNNLSDGAFLRDGSCCQSRWQAHRIEIQSRRRSYLTNPGIASEISEKEDSIQFLWNLRTMECLGELP